MKKLLLLGPLVLFFISSSSNVEQAPGPVASHVPSCNCKDTLNFTDGNNIKHGHWIENDSAGHRVHEMCYLAGVLNGPYIEYYADNRGGIKISGQYKAGKKDGEWKYFDAADAVIKTELYENDVLVSTHLAE